MAGRADYFNFTFDCPSPASFSTTAGPSHIYGAGPSRVQLPSVHEAFREPFMPSAQNGQQAEREPLPPMTGDPSFDILDWYPAYQSCQQFFLDHSQHEQATQALCALINIRLPFQYPKDPLASSRPPASASPAHAGSSSSSNGGFTFSYPPPNGSTIRKGNQYNPPQSVSLIPYIRRLIVTGFDKPAILHGFFGDDYNRGILPHLDCERRNYLFAAKQGGWRNCKTLYDTGSGTSGDESVPFLKPLDGTQLEELAAAEKAWNSWQAMEDWTLGPRAPREEERRLYGGGFEDAPANIGSSQRIADNLPDGVPEAYEGGE